jgi:hypothetical protein
VISTEQRNKVLESELKRANAEIAKLRRRLNESGAHGKRLDRAYADALLLATYHVGYQSTSRRSADECAKISRSRHQNAVALLRLAKVHNGRQFLHHDLVTIEERLAQAKDLALDEPSAYRARLPKYERERQKRRAR